MSTPVIGSDGERVVHSVRQHRKVEQKVNWMKGLE